jgi:hypothetical protein
MSAPVQPPMQPPMQSPTARYPIDIRFDTTQRVSRFWGIPFVGLFVRYLLLIPHFFALGIFGLVAGIAILFSWLPVLLMGRQAGWVYDIVGGYLRWTYRVLAWAYLMVGPYPPFSTGPGYPVEVDFDRSTRVSRLWGIPLLGIFLRSIFLIPYLVLLWIVSILAGFILFFAWIPVLLFGHFPQIGYDIVGGYMRVSLRASGWLLLMAGPYPPFGLN